MTTSRPDTLLDDFKRFGDKNRREPYRCRIESTGQSSTLIFIWPPGSSTPIHDHDGALVTINVLSGSLKRETLRKLEDGFEYINRFVYKTGGKIEENGHLVHKVSNASFSQWAMSIHVYKPPQGKPYTMREYIDGSPEPVLVSGYESLTELLPII